MARSVSARSRSGAGGRRNGGGREVIEQAALNAFYLRGYYGTSIRDIAAAAEMTPASLYHHFASKQDILRVVMTQIMQAALKTTRASLLRAGASPDEQLRALMSSWVEFHATRQIEARVGLSELNSLEDEGRRVVIALRDEQELMFREVVLRGAEEGVFHTAHPIEAARAIVNMGTAVATWFRTDGQHSALALSEVYAALACAVVHSAGPPISSSAARNDPLEAR